MALPGMSPERNLPGYEIARLTGYGALDFNFKALGDAMDCTREFAQAGSGAFNRVDYPCAKSPYQ